jgi:tetraprenyl-beta-curcumene synthase
MLDSYVDRGEDAANGHHSYISHYGDTASAVDRLCQIVERAAHETRALPSGHRHATLVACMVAMHLSSDTADGARADMRALANAGGPLTRLLVPLARLWRATYLQRPAMEGRQ